MTLSGSPTIVDAAASPPQRFELQRLALAASDVTWPGRRPLRLDAGGVIRDVALTLSAGPLVRIADDRVTFTVDELVVRRGCGRN